MTDERLQILKMVEQGKVSAEEAAKLLEALEQPAQPGRLPAPKATHMRLVIREKGKTQQISFGLWLAKMAVKFPGTVFFNGAGAADQVDSSLLKQAIEKGVVGKVVDIEQGNDRFEIWLDP